MEAERWKIIENLYHSALARDASDRASFLAERCKKDDELREEVESLLACHSQATDFIEAPALQVAAQLLTQEEVEAHSPRSLSPGTSISHYQILEKIGAGGMGEVYRAHDPRLGRDVAIKVLPEAYSTEPERLRRFEQEARAAAALNHPNIVAIYDVGTWDYGTPYVVSELLQGETLRTCLQRGPLPVRKAVEIASQVALGLSAAHEKGIIHRDLKPENLWLTQDGHVKILDFGLAKLLPEKAIAPELTTVAETNSTAVMGTIGYMSPEQVRGQKLDQRTDIFSLGAVIYETLSGRRAFKGPTPADTISAILGQDPAELTASNHAIPKVVSGIVRRALEKNPNDRFHSARDVSYALAAASEAETPDRAPSTARPAHSSWKWVTAAILILASALLIWNRQALLHPIAIGRGPVRSLAVLPLENVSGDSQQDYFADGMTDELITQLAGLNDVRVISRSSVMRFRGSKQPLPEIAGLLHVDSIVEGSVLRNGNRVRITAQLVQAATDRHLWAHSYEGDLADIFRLQNEVARSVTEEIKAKLDPQETKRMQAVQQPVPPEAYDAYLKGLYFSAKLTPDDLQKGFDYFNKAIDADPTFAPAYAGMAEAYSWAGGLDILPSQQVWPKVEAAASKALEMDPNLGTAHHALAWVHYALHWDFPGAEREFQRATELSPNNSTAHLWYGMFLAQRNRTEQSLDEMRRAKQLDPLSSIVNGLSLTPLLTSRQYDKVIAAAKEALISTPNDGVLNWLLFSAYEQKGDLGKAIDQQEKMAIAYGEDPHKASVEFAAIRSDLAARGPRAYWLNHEKSMAASPGADPFAMATVEARLGNEDAMYANLDKAFNQRSTEMLYWMQTNPAFDNFRSGIRFRDLLRRMGLTE